MILADALALFLIMGFLAAIPSSSMLLVVTTALGLRNGVATAAQHRTGLLDQAAGVTPTTG